MTTNLKKKENEADSRFTRFQASHVQAKPVVLESRTNSGGLRTMFWLPITIIQGQRNNQS